MKKYTQNLFKIIATATSLLLPIIATAQINSTADKFPDISSSYLKTGSFIAIENIRLVEFGTSKNSKNSLNKGMNKDQIRSLLGNPHFNEGLSNNKEWNYVFNISKKNSDASSGEFMTCQFQIAFDEESRSMSTEWKTDNCKNN